MSNVAFTYINLQMMIQKFCFCFKADMQEFEQDFIIAIYAIPHEGKILVSARNFCNIPNDIVLVDRRC